MVTAGESILQGRVLFEAHSGRLGRDLLAGGAGGLFAGGLVALSRASSEWLRFAWANRHAPSSRTKPLRPKDR